MATGPDVAIAVAKASHDAYKNIKEVVINDKGSVPYRVEKKFKASIIRLIPAAPGTGLKAGSSVRSVLELAGYTNILSKIIGTNNKLNNALLVIDILSSYKQFTKNKTGHKVTGLAVSQSSPYYEKKANKTTTEDSSTDKTTETVADEKIAKTPIKKTALKKSPAKKPVAKKATEANTTD